MLAAVLISVIVASLSNALALLLRQQEALIGISQFIVLPLQFLSSAIMDTRLSPPGCSTSPGTTRSTGRWSPPPGPLGQYRVGRCLAPARVPRGVATMAWLATRAFGSYQRSI